MKATPLVAFALTVLAGVAHADPPTVDAVKAALPKWTDAIAVPFTYQGMRYEGDDYAKVQACDQAFGAHGVIKDAKKVPQFAGCVAISTAVHAVAGKPDVAAFDVKHVSMEMETTIEATQESSKEIQRGYPKKLAKLVKKGGAFVSHVTKPDGGDGYWDEAWNVYVAHVDGGAVRFDALMVVLSEPSPD